MSAALGPWEPLKPGEVAGLLEPCAVPWWIAGGYAIDAFVGELDRRPHEDADVGLLARDQQAIRACLGGWEAWCADPPGTLRPWRPGETLSEPVHDVWLRPAARRPWRLALLLNTHEGDTWTYRRDPRIRLPLSELARPIDGIPYLVPEVQLLFKAKSPRPKDEVDFEDTLPRLDERQQRRLRRWLELAHPGHPWIARLAGRGVRRPL